MKKIRLVNRDIHNHSSPFVIAEIGANHNGDMKLAKQLIDSAVASGVDAVKFQSWKPNSINSNREYEKNESYSDSKKKHFGSLREMDEKYHLSDSQHFELKKYCDEKKVTFCSTPFTRQEIDLLEKCKVPFYKIASMDINNFQLLEYVATKNKPVILSTGMANLGEIEKAISLLHQNDCNDVILLHCISIYPPQFKDINLKNIQMLQEVFDVPVGFSDHSIGTSIPLASIAFGACVIEKHFTIDKNLPGWDHEISADPNELKILCEEAKNVHQSIGSYQRIVSNAEKEKKKKFRRSIVVKRDLKKGSILSEGDLTSKRPGTGISPDLMEFVIGKELKNDLASDDLLDWKDIG